MRIYPQRHGGIGVAEPTGYRTNVGSSPARSSRREVSPFVEVGFDAKLVRRPLVVVRESVGDERAAAGGLRFSRGAWPNPHVFERHGDLELRK